MHTTIKIDGKIVDSFKSVEISFTSLDESSDGTTVPPEPFLVDDNGNKFAIYQGKVIQNDVKPHRMMAAKLYYRNRRVYALTPHAQWYCWSRDGITWVGAHDPVKE